MEFMKEKFVVLEQIRKVVGYDCKLSRILELKENFDKTEKEF